jgi:hypothetical protein
MLVTAALAGNGASVAPTKADAARALKASIAYRLSFMTLPLEADRFRVDRSRVRLRMRQ